MLSKLGCWLSLWQATLTLFGAVLAQPESTFNCPFCFLFSLILAVCSLTLSFSFSLSPSRSPLSLFLDLSFLLPAGIVVEPSATHSYIIFLWCCCVFLSLIRHPLAQTIVSSSLQPSTGELALLVDQQVGGQEKAGTTTDHVN